MRRFSILVLFVLIGLISACTASEKIGELEVNHVWGRNSPQVAQNGAFYMVITNNSGEDEQLLGGMSDACKTIELHEMYIKENDVMGMRQVPGGIIDIPAGATVELKVGGLHVMCIDKQMAFEVGDKIPIKLNFANLGELQVTADIRESEMK